MAWKVCPPRVKLAAMGDVCEDHVGEGKGQTRKDCLHAIAGLSGALCGCRPDVENPFTRLHGESANAGMSRG